LIDIVLSGDNAIVIGMATKDLQGKERKRAIAIGIALATALRVLFASTVVYLMRVVGIKFAGGLLLLYVVWKFYRELRSAEGEGEGGGGGKREARTLASAVWLILIADVSMSLDNVLAVSGASRENIIVLGIGLVVSIILMAIASGFIASKLEKYPQIQWAGLLVILFVALEMMLSGTHELEEKVFHFNLLPVILFVLVLGGCALHHRYIKPARLLHEASCPPLLRLHADHFCGDRASGHGAASFGEALVSEVVIGVECASAGESRSIGRDVHAPRFR
jgi:YjbE family integral membrane protein